MPLVVVLGATGAGKSKLALEIATKFNGEIISADSMQVYKGLDIITNKVTPEEQVHCKHHLLDYVDPLVTSYRVTDFRDAALPIEVQNHPELQDESKEDAADLQSDSSSEEEIEKEPKKKRERDEYVGIESVELHRKLKDVDPEMALKLHPNNRRKIIRALEVFRKHGSKMTEILKLQHEEMGCSHALSGPLRFPNTCCIWVNANQDVLDDRINNRTEDMISRGLLQELTGFHDNYNKQRLQENKAPDYTHGIFQSIGFKEFHQYLILSEDEKNSERGRLLFKEGKEQLQLVTRRYARKQKKWITNRFLKRPGEAPPVFAVDSTYPDQWEKDAQKPAFSVVQAFLKGEDYPIEPLPRGDNSANQPEHNVCEACEKVFLTKQQWADHTKSRKHQKRLAKWKHNRNKADSNEHTNKTDNSDGDTVNELNNKNDTIAGAS